MNVLLDTGSSSLAIAGQRYTPARDTSLAATAYAQQITYGQGRLAGPVVRAMVGVGDKDQRRGVDAVAFTCVEGEAPYFFRDADGILGLAYKHLNSAHDLTTLLQTEGHDPALTWPWPTRASTPNSRARSRNSVEQQPRLELQLAVQCARSTRRVRRRVRAAGVPPVAHVLDDAATAAQLHGDPLNRGTLVLGGGEECQDLYDGAFADLRVVHDIYYNVNLLSVQVGDRTPIPAPALDPRYADTAASNAIIDTGSSFVMLEASLYDAVIEGFRTHDARLPELVTQFSDALANGHGLPNSTIRTADWPALHLRFEAPGGGETCLRCEPDHYWQRNGYYANQSVFLLMRQTPNWPNQSVLGLPLLCDRYCVFDRRDDGTGRIRFARARAER